MVENTEDQSNDSEIEVEKKSFFSFTPYSIYRFFGLFLIVVSLVFYFSWNILYDDWADIGMYSFVAPTVLFGLLSIALGFEKEKQEN